MSKLVVPLIKEVRDNLNQAGFQVSLIETNINTCFDIIARKQKLTLLIKCLYYIDKFKSLLAEELKMVSHLVSAYPILIGKYTRKEGSEVHPGVIYDRKGILTMNDKTLTEVVNNNIFPIIMAKRGKYYINLQKERLRERRLELNLSLKGLADKIHTSRRTISMYESGKISAKLDSVIELEKALDISLELLAEPLNIFKMIKEHITNLNIRRNSTPIEADFQNELNEYFQEIGLDTFWTNKSLFDAIASENPDFSKFPASIKKHFIITGIENDNNQALKTKVRTINNISKVLQSLSMLIVDDTVDLKSNVPVLSFKDLKKIKDGKELIKKLYRLSNY